MVEFTQEIHNLLGSKKAIDKLAKQENCRILAVSDSHGSYHKLHGIVKNFGKECDALIFSGDGICDLAKLIEAGKEDKEFAECIPPVIAFVQGNNDPGSYPVERGFALTVPQNQILTAAGKNIYIVHGHHQGVDFGLDILAYEAMEADCSLAVYGHTHISSEELRGNDSLFKLINPGSCSRPRGGLPASFAILTVTKNFEDTAFIKIENGPDLENSYEIFHPF